MSATIEWAHVRTGDRATVHYPDDGTAVGDGLDPGEVAVSVGTVAIYADDHDTLATFLLGASHAVVVDMLADDPGDPGGHVRTIPGPTNGRGGSLAARPIVDQEGDESPDTLTVYSTVANDHGWTITDGNGVVYVVAPGQTVDMVKEGSA